MNHRARLFECVGEPDNPPFKHANGIEQAYAGRVLHVDPTSLSKDRVMLVQVPNMETEDPLEPGLYLVRRIVNIGGGNAPHGRYHLVICTPEGQLAPIWTWMLTDEPQTKGRTMMQGQIPENRLDLSYIAGALDAVTALYYPNENLPHNVQFFGNHQYVPKELAERQKQYTKPLGF